MLQHFRRLKGSDNLDDNVRISVELVADVFVKMRPFFAPHIGFIEHVAHGWRALCICDMWPALVSSDQMYTMFRDIL